jgi:O-antigen chain-terminating methyltransferase
MKEVERNDVGEYFYRHYSQDNLTGPGKAIVQATAKRIFDFCDLRSGTRVLEIGPGRGDFADICRQNNIHYSAIEANKEMADRLTSRGFKVIYSMVPPLPIIEEKFDAVIMIHVMEHMDTMTQALELSRNVFNLLKPGGYFIISSPDYVNCKHLFFYGDFSHNYITSKRRLEGLLLSSGFKEIAWVYLSGPISGLGCFLLSGIVARIPLQMLSVLFPKSNVINKAMKLQGTLLRSVLIRGIR